MCSYLLQVDSPQLGQDEGMEEGTHVDHRGLALLSKPCQDHLGAGRGEGAGEKERVQVKERLQEQEQEQVKETVCQEQEHLYVVSYVTGCLQRNGLAGPAALPAAHQQRVV